MEKLRCKKRNKGFSLIEVIISVGILGVGIVAVMQSLSFASRVTGLSGDLLQATYVAQDLIQSLQAKGMMRGLSGGAKSDAAGKFQREYILEFNPSTNLYELTLKVNWERLRRKESIQIESELLN